MTETAEFGGANRQPFPYQRTRDLSSDQVTEQH